MMHPVFPKQPTPVIEHFWVDVRMWVKTLLNIINLNVLQTHSTKKRTFNLDKTTDISFSKRYCPTIVIR